MVVVVVVEEEEVQGSGEWVGRGRGFDRARMSRLIATLTCSKLEGLFKRGGGVVEGEGLSGGEAECLL